MAAYARTMCNTVYVVGTETGGAFAQVVRPLPSVLDNAVVKLVEQSLSMFLEEATETRDAAKAGWAKGHAWAALPEYQHGSALRAYDRIAALAAGWPPATLAPPRAWTSEWALWPLEARLPRG